MVAEQSSAAAGETATAGIASESDHPAAPQTARLPPPAVGGAEPRRAQGARRAIPSVPSGNRRAPSAPSGDGRSQVTGRSSRGATVGVVTSRGSGGLPAASALLNQGRSLGAERLAPKTCISMSVELPAHRTEADGAAAVARTLSAVDSGLPGFPGQLVGLRAEAAGFRYQAPPHSPGAGVLYLPRSATLPLTALPI